MLVHARGAFTCVHEQGGHAPGFAPAGKRLFWPRGHTGRGHSGNIHPAAAESRFPAYSVRA